MEFTGSLPSELYLRVRQKEGRLYPDNIVVRLPFVPASEPLRKEWEARAASLGRFMRYLSQLPGPISVMELGCGNGWLSQHISSLKDVRVLGIDRNHVELAQAARLFRHTNLAFINADISAPPLRAPSFDIIVLASVIQYFAELGSLIRESRVLLRPGGALHIFDSPLYEQAELAAAQRRTRVYYAELGLPEMAEYYFHHTYAEVQEYSPHWLYRPNSPHARLTRLLGRVISPFPWLAIY